MEESENSAKKSANLNMFKYVYIPLASSLAPESVASLRLNHIESRLNPGEAKPSAPARSCFIDGMLMFWKTC